jgi:hypothetical protein
MHILADLFAVFLFKEDTLCVHLGHLRGPELARGESLGLDSRRSARWSMLLRCERVWGRAPAFCDAAG